MLLSHRFKYKLSIIVVNYNVEHFLDQCLDAVQKAIASIPAEVIIVDNNSVDGSVRMLRKKYPRFRLIPNRENVGFSKANNQAIRTAEGEYILLLNPDTVVAEDTFEKTVNFMDEHPDCGALGVRMIDGKGNFLAESKRGLPTPMVAFYKIFGLSSLFPNSKRFAQYHQGHLSEFETRQVDILSGAFMLIRKAALDKVGFLDEDYFMYGEDIDLSYRIMQGGYSNYYFPETTIVHYKGESTKKSSVNYVFIFYRAMVIFAKKHFSGNNAWFFSLLINLAIYLRAGIAIVHRFIRAITLPFIDMLYMLMGLSALTNYWEMYNIHFPVNLLSYAIPAYAITWIASTYLVGGYDVPIRLFNFFKGTILGTFVILVLYALLPKELQFSRLFIFAGAGWMVVYYLISRWFLHQFFGDKHKLFVRAKKDFIVFSYAKEFNRIKKLLSTSQAQLGSVKVVDPNTTSVPANGEIIFSADDLTYGNIIRRMSALREFRHDFKIARSGTNLLIGSNSIDSPGELYLIEINALERLENRRKKRLFDIGVSIILLLLSPVLIFAVAHRQRFFSNCWLLLIGKRTVVGYSDVEMKTNVRLPKIRIGLISPTTIIDTNDHSIKEKLNVLYSRDYSMRKDLSVLLKSWRKLGQ